MSVRVCVHICARRSAAQPSVRVCRVHEGGTLGCPRPERALLDRVTLNIRAARAHHTFAFPLFRCWYSRAANERASEHVIRTAISDEPDEFARDKHASGISSASVNAPSSRISHQRHAYSFTIIMRYRVRLYMLPDTTLRRGFHLPH